MGPADLVIASADWQAERESALTEKTRLERELAAEKARVDGLEDALAACLDRPTDQPAGGCGFDPGKVDWDHVIHLPKPTAGTTYENVVLTGRVSTVPGLALVNCAVRGTSPPTAGSAGIINSYAAGTRDIWFEDLLIEATVKSVAWSAGVFGHGFTATRVSVRGTVDGFGLYHPDKLPHRTRLIDCDVDDLTFFAVDPAHTDGTHNDGIQIHSPPIDVEILGGRYNAGPKGTAGLLYNGTSANGLRVSRAWIGGGRSAVNFGPTPSGTCEIVYSTLASPTDLYARTPLVIRLDGTKRPDGTPVIRKPS